ncbi:G-protein coupled bile acid receptor 1-like [Pristis pectinata]|uniref:G-protein coupled bile acid receptor 1-like n=1 Tax=Pristis pectinata TaxID=685728 RepID=UPI00223D13A5|nr:G-protein coupled bile acid receptor 1-like [Pristis pectinata]
MTLRHREAMRRGGVAAANLPEGDIQRHSAQRLRTVGRGSAVGSWTPPARDMNGSGLGCSNHSGGCLTPHQALIHWLTLPLSGIIVAGNLLVVGTLLGSRRTHAATDRFFLSLALADLATGVVLPSVPGLGFGRPLAPRLCFFAHLFPNFILLSLMANVLLVHCDRYLYIARPLRYHRAWLRHRAPAALLAVWLLPLLFASLPLLGWNRWPASEPHHCHFSLVFPPEYIYLEVYGLLIPAILASGALNACLLRLARGQMRDIQRQCRAVRGRAPALEHQLNLRLAKSVTGFLLVFLGCWLPYIVHLHARFLGPAGGARAHIVLSCLGICSAALLPFALALGNREYLRVWSRACGRRRPPSLESGARGLCRPPPAGPAGCDPAPDAGIG